MTSRKPYHGSCKHGYVDLQKKANLRYVKKQKKNMRAAAAAATQGSVESKPMYFHNSCLWTIENIVFPMYLCLQTRNCNPVCGYLPETNRKYIKKNTPGANKQKDRGVTVRDGSRM